MNLPIAFANLWMVAIYFISLSYLVRGNPFFTAVQQMVIGILAAQHMMISFNALRSSILIPVQGGNYIKLIYLLFSFLIFASVFKNWRWLSRYPTAIMAGTGLGLVLRNIMYTEVLSQIQESIVPLKGQLFADFSNVSFVITLCLSLFYFMFGFDLKGPWIKVNKVARFLIIVGLGASNGAAYWTRASLDYGGMYQVREWLQLFWLNIH